MSDPYPTVDGQAQAGRVIVLYGGAGRKQELARPHPVGLWQPPVAGDQFGYAADALEDVGQGGTPDPDAYAVAIGAPGTNVGGDDDAGWVGFLVAVDGGNVLMEATQVQVFPVADLEAESSYAQNSPGVPGGVHAGDKFGTTLAFMAGASERALIIGVPDDSTTAMEWSMSSRWVGVHRATGRPESTSSRRAARAGSAALRPASTAAAHNDSTAGRNPRLSQVVVRTGGARWGAPRQRRHGGSP